MDDLGEVIYYHRKKAGLSRDQLSELGGLGKKAIYDIEKGKKSIQLDTLLKILKVLNIQIKLDSPLMPYYIKDKHAQG